MERDRTPPSFTQRVATNVAETIDTSGVTVTWLCERTGIPRTTLTRRLSGLSPFTTAELDALADALRVEIDVLTGNPLGATA